MNILIVGHDTFENKGCQALVVTTVRMLNENFPGSLFKVFSWDPEYDFPRFQQPNIPCEFVRHKFQTNEFSPRNRFWLFLRGTLGVKTERILQVPLYFWDALNWADLVVVSGGDILADYGEAAVKHYFFPIAVASALGKGVYVFAQSISRYENDKLRDFCIPILDKVNLITVRERISFEYLEELGLKAPFRLTADPAFTLQPSSAERTAEIAQAEGVPMDGRPLIGFSVSRTVTRWGGGDQTSFVQETARAIDQLAENHSGASFIFVPHVTFRNDSENDDRLVGREVFEKISRKKQVHLIEGDYTCQEAKGLIGLCDVFVGARTHATIASTSQLVPTLALAYSTKAYGIMEDVLDRNRCVLDVREITAEKLVYMVDDLLLNQQDIVQLMRRRIEKIRVASQLNGELAQKFFSFQIRKD